MAAVQRNPKDSMKSTWRTDKSKWNHHHYMATYLGINITDVGRDVPVHQKSDKLPGITHLEGHYWILAHALWPIAVHQLYVWYTGKNLGYITTLIWYALAFKLNAVHELNVVRNLGHKYGFLDGDKHERDQIPDHAVDSVFYSLMMTSTGRPLYTLIIAYRVSQTPDMVNWWLIPFEIGFYTVILDFWFYWYHRCMHDIDGLWQYHRTHHLTKHPNPLLSLYADHEQELFDIFVIPFMTWGTMKLMGFPMGFYEWWICHQYIVWTELWGHSGLRMWVTPPTTATPFLKLFDGELQTEDHDLHHRKGWKKSHNYGKQTRLWDQLFGTTHERYEAKLDNVDWSEKVRMKPFFFF